ncbi:Thioredoxin-like 4 [Nymphaea thermarum]|nr:Thioredoxin-like 4 [Nymphaea thermarum]
MQRQGLVYSQEPFAFAKASVQLRCSRFSHARACWLDEGSRRQIKILLLSPSTVFPRRDSKRLEMLSNCSFHGGGYEGLKDLNKVEPCEVDEDDSICPVECVREFKTDAEFSRILEKAKATDSLVVVDFYRTSCGSCKYIEQGFSKLCKGSGGREDSVIFLKHNVIDEYDEESEVAERLKIRAVPLFHFYKGGNLVEAFPTRDKERILATIIKYTSTSHLDED